MQTVSILKLVFIKFVVTKDKNTTISSAIFQLLKWCLNISYLVEPEDLPGRVLSM